MIDRLFAIFSGLVTRIHEEVCSQQPFYLPYTWANGTYLEGETGIAESEILVMFETEQREIFFFTISPGLI